MAKFGWSSKHWAYKTIRILVYAEPREMSLERIILSATALAGTSINRWVVLGVVFVLRAKLLKLSNHIYFR